MKKGENLTNKIFGGIAVLSLKEVKNDRYYWTGQCVCGKIVVSRSDVIKKLNYCRYCKLYISGKVPGLQTWSHKFRAYKKRALKNNLVFSLSFEEFKNICTKNCFYCNAEPKLLNYSHRHKALTQEGKGRQSIYFNGIDRIDSTLGYFHDNIRPCCKICNVAKSNLKEADFYAWINKVFKFLKL